MATDPAHIARQCYQAFADGDRAEMEALLAEDFHFTSPRDNRIDRRAYFERCWPHHERVEDFEFTDVLSEGDRVAVAYEARTPEGTRFRNCEVLTVHGGRVTEIEVYFGWDVPHHVAPGASSPPE